MRQFYCSARSRSPGCGKTGFAERRIRRLADQRLAHRSTASALAVRPASIARPRSAPTRLTNSPTTKLPLSGSADSVLRRRRADDVVEADGPCRAAELDEAEMPGRRRHRAPLLTLSADLEGAAPSARGRRADPARKAPDLRA